MTHLESEIKSLKAETTDMWKLVLSQMKKTFHSFKTFDKDFAREVVSNEKRVNSMELQIDRDCENILALHTPVAVDLRFVLATLKIINNLERVGDIAEGISLYIIGQKEPFDEELLRMTKLIEMFEGANNIVEDVLNAFETDDTKLARSIFHKDERLDEINAEANSNIAEYITKYPERTEQALNALSTIRRLERVGDQSKNIAEEIIFSVEAKVLRHR